ncbi:MAG: thioredoxin-dependent thiol peroxidase [Verrucomicrobium sp.]|nr:thioredoxin-dependent thiol peroxidase [Verrucomicrobium sp.]
MASQKVGGKAPAFSGETQDGGKISLKDFAGKPLVLFFYPKDNTPGCTVESCDFRDRHDALLTAGAAVVGVSPDPVKSHQKFAEKFGLPYPLLADVEKKTSEAYGVWVEKSLYGRKYMGIARTTFLIDPAGKIARIWEKVKPEGHASEVLAALKDLS